LKQYNVLAIDKSGINPLLSLVRWSYGIDRVLTSECVCNRQTSG